MEKWLCLLTISAPIVNFGSEGSRSSRRVDKIDGEHPGGLPCVEGWSALVALMVSMVCRHKGSLTWKSPLVLGGDEWRRMVSSMGDWGADTEALTWKSLCVPSGEGDIHSCSLIFLLDSEQICSASSLSWNDFCVSCCIVSLAGLSFFCLPSQLSRSCFF